MADRPCPKCGAATSPKLKFCRECGGRVDAPASPEPATGPADPAAGADDATLIGAAPRPPAGPPSHSIPLPDPEESDEPVPSAQKRRPDDDSDATMISGKAARASAVTAKEESIAPPPASTPAPAGSGDETIISGALRARIAAAAAPPPAVEDPPEEFQKTFIGTSLPGLPPAKTAAAPPATPSAAAPPPAPPPPSASPKSVPLSPGDPPARATVIEPATPPRKPEPAPLTPTGDAAEAPVHDDLGVGDESEATGPVEIRTTSHASPRSPATAIVPASAPPPDPAPGPPPPVVDGAPRLEHWSPRVKGDVVTVEKDEVLVGRDRGELRYPEDNFLSKKHARFFRDGKGALCVEDLGTLNGTFLRLTQPARLEHRDVLVVGRHAFRFELLEFAEKDDRTLEGDPLTRVQGVQGRAPRARLVKRQEEGFRGLPYYFGTQRYVLGRTDGTHNFQRDDRMSRRHAALQFTDGDYWLEDLGSQNGTFLRLRGARVLQKGDTVMMGDQYFKYV